MMGEDMIQAQAMAARFDPLLTGAAGHVRELMLAVGRPADGAWSSARGGGCWRACGPGTASEQQHWRWKGTRGACSMCGAWRCRAGRRLRARKRDDDGDQ
jgi:hypothetical protein